MSNSAKNGKKNFGGSGGTAADFSDFRVGTCNSKNLQKKIGLLSLKYVSYDLNMCSFGG